MDIGLALEIALPALLLSVLALLGWRQRRARFLALLAGLVVAALAGEATLRLLEVGVPARAVWTEELTAGRAAGPAYWPGGELVYRYPNNPRGYFERDGTVRGHINSLGFRGQERTLSKPPGATRIAVLGDSFTLGIGVRDEDTLPASLERVLGGSPVEVLNFGISASDTLEQVHYLSSYVQQFDSDVVVLVFFLNDTERASTLEYLTRPRAFPALRRYSHLLQTLLASVERAVLRGQMLRHYRDGYQDTSPAWRAVQDALRRAKLLLDERGIAFVVAIQPVLMDLDPDRYPFVGIHETVARFCRGAGIPVLDLFDALAGHSAKRLWVHESDRHPNEVANQITARALAEFLRRAGLVH